jgi:hypothetical protein
MIKSQDKAIRYFPDCLGRLIARIFFKSSRVNAVDLTIVNHGHILAQSRIGCELLVRGDGFQHGVRIDKTPHSKRISKNRRRAIVSSLFVPMTQRLRYALIASAILLIAAAAGQDTFTGVQRIVVAGDIHGDYDRLIEILRTGNLIDRKNDWCGGKAHFVLIGDMVDRGPASRKVLDYVMALQTQAERSGGAVHALIGNHEVMNMIDDLRYVSKEDWVSYQTPNSEELRNKAANSALKSAKEDSKAKGTKPPDAAKFLADFNADHPLGWVEHCLLFGPSGKYGKWLREQKVIIKINDLIFVHAGIPPKYTNATRDEINRAAIAEVDDPVKLADGMITTEEGPLWYRDLLTAPEDQAELVEQVDRILNTRQVRRIIVGHTVMPAITPRFGGKVIGVDVGLSVFFKGPPEFLVIEGARFTVVCRGQRIDFPSDGRNVLQYLRGVAKADPENTALRKLIEPTQR